MAVVTLSRQFGAGGLRVASALADALGYRWVDREIVEEAARRLGMEPDVARSRDERSPAILEEVGLALTAVGLGFGQAPMTPLGDRDLAEATRTVIESLAATGGYVIVGRGAQSVLRDKADACHVALVGHLADRARRIAQWQGIPEGEALERCRRVDADRAAYVKRFYGDDIRDPLLYDAVLNTSTLGIEGAGAAALLVARGKLGLAG